MAARAECWAAGAPLQGELPCAPREAQVVGGEPVSPPLGFHWDWGTYRARPPAARDSALLGSQLLPHLQSQQYRVRKARLLLWPGPRGSPGHLC